MGPSWVMNVYSYADDYGAFCSASVKATSNWMTGAVVEKPTERWLVAFGRQVL